VQHFADLQKQKAAEKAALDKLEMYGVRSQMQNDLYANLRETPAEREAKLNRLLAKDKTDSELHAAALEESRIKNAGTQKSALTSEFDRQMKFKYPLLGIGSLSKEDQARYDADVRKFENDPNHLRINKVLGINNDFAGYKVLPN
jgi:hypothetical protein